MAVGSFFFSAAPTFIQPSLVGSLAVVLSSGHQLNNQNVKQPFACQRHNQTVNIDN